MLPANVDVAELVRERVPPISSIRSGVKISALSKLRNLSIRPVLVHVNGVADSDVEKGCFDKIIDFSALLTH